MKKTILFVFLFTLLHSCSKSDGDSNVNPLEKEYKSLTSDNVNMFFLESAKVSKGCNGAQCNSSYTFEFKNLNYVTEISRMSTLTPNSTILWNFYIGDKQTVGAIGNYYEGQYALKYTLEDGRVLTSAWIKF